MFMMTDRARDIAKMGLVRIAVREILGFRFLSKLFRGPMAYKALLAFHCTFAVECGYGFTMAVGAFNALLGMSTCIL